MSVLNKKPFVDPNTEINRLIHLGKLAHTRGDNKQAHLYLRQAATLAPSDVRVWLALLDIVTAPQDLAVIIQNIHNIDPENSELRRRLSDIQSHTQPSAPIVLPIQPTEPDNGVFLRIFLALIAGAIIAVGIVAIQVFLGI